MYTAVLHNWQDMQKLWITWLETKDNLERIAETIVQRKEKQVRETREKPPPTNVAEGKKGTQSVVACALPM